MAVKNTTQVLIGGKIVTLSGYESEEYLQKVANYMNNKLTELGQIPGYNRQTLETRHTLLSLNIADDYFKARKQIGLLEEELQGKEKELYDLKHELVASQIKLENTEKSLKSVQKELNESSKKIVRLETELADKNDRNKKA